MLTCTECGEQRTFVSPKHGTPTHYRKGCRCQKCVAFVKNYQEMRKEREKHATA